LAIPEEQATPSLIGGIGIFSQRVLTVLILESSGKKEIPSLGEGIRISKSVLV
jgi:hypothetical protein